MVELSEQACEACRVGAPLVSDEELQRLLPTIPGWRVIEVDGVRQLTREFEFKNFAQALAFTNRVGDLAEAENHHPAIVTEWGRVTVTWWTHKIHGLHRNDLILAARTDQAYAL